MTKAQARATLLQSARQEVIKLIKAQGLKPCTFQRKEVDRAAICLIAMHYAEKTGYKLVLKVKNGKHA